MTILKTIWTIFILTILAVKTFATSWRPIYPYIQKTEDGKVKTHSIPYGVHDGPFGPGQTFVYANGKLLYSIDKYFGTPFFTTNNGQYLIEFDFFLNYKENIVSIPVDSNNYTYRYEVDGNLYEGDAINIYKDGKLIKTIAFAELKIDTSMIRVNTFGNFFEWKFITSDTTKDVLKMKMSLFPAYIENDKLKLITADNQLIAVDIPTGQITDRQNAYETLKQKSNWTPKTFNRKYKKVKYPDKFLLPHLKNGKTIDQGLAELFKKTISNGDRDSAVIQIYFHTLLINKEGKCEVIYSSPSTRKDFKKDNYIDDPKLQIEIENWINQQTFKTKTFPKGFQKFKYTGFVYLK